MYKRIYLKLFLINLYSKRSVYRLILLVFKNTLFRFSIMFELVHCKVNLEFRTRHQPKATAHLSAIAQVTRELS